MLFLGPPLGDLIDAPFNPWAHSLRGGPTLVGTWVGTLTAPGARRAALFLELRRSRNSRGRYSTCRHCPRIEGAARLCDGGDPKIYEVWGGPDNWSGARFHLKKRAAGPARPGLQLGYMRGEWGGDVLNLSTQFESGGDEPEARAGGGRGTDVAVRFALKRGGEREFLAACREL